jgi:hypothetical protein
MSIKTGKRLFDDGYAVPLSWAFVAALAQTAVFLFAGGVAYGKLDQRIEHSATSERMARVEERLEAIKAVVDRIDRRTEGK